MGTTSRTRRQGGAKEKELAHAPTSKPSKRDFLAHVYQYVHYVEYVLCTRTHWPESTVRKKGIQLKQMMQDMED